MMISSENSSPATSGTLIERAAQRLGLTPETTLADTGPAPSPPVMPTDTPLETLLVEMPLRALAEEPGAAVADAPAAAPAQRVELDFEWMRRHNLLTPDTMSGTLAEEVRLIRRALHLHLNEGGRGGAIMVTSALPGEGKSFTAINIAISVAEERDMEAVLVDADLARPWVLNSLGLKARENQRGLDTLLKDHGTRVADCLLHTNLPRLLLLPSNPVPGNATELLKSRRMDEVLEQLTLGHPNRLVIFDSAPVLATTLPTALFDRVRQVLFIVEAGRTRRRDVDEALGVLGDHTPVAMVINKARGVIGDRTPGAYGTYGAYGKQPADSEA